MEMKLETPLDFDLTCWYLNRRRIIELIGGATIPFPPNSTVLPPSMNIGDASMKWARSRTPLLLGVLPRHHGRSLTYDIRKLIPDLPCVGGECRQSQPKKATA